MSVKLLKSKRTYRIFSALFLLLFFWAFLRLHSAIPLLGDGSVRANEIYDGRMWQPTEMLDFLIHAVLYQYVFSPLGYKVTVCYRVVSAVSGLVFLIGAYRLAYYLYRSSFFLPFLLILSSGMTALFFGYVESYSILAALLPFIVLSGIKVADGNGNATSFLLLVLIAMLVHSVAAILFVPMTVVVIAGFRSGRKAVTSKWLLVFTATLIVGGYVARFTGLSSAHRYLLPIAAPGQFPPGILSTTHFLNILNWLFLSGLPFLAFLPLVGNALLQSDNSRRHIVLWLMLPSALFMFFFVPQIGAARDWDLFSLPAFVLLLCPMVLGVPFEQSRIRWLALPVTTVSLIILASFVGVNHSVPKSVERFVDIIEITKHKNLFLEYARLYRQSQGHDELREKRLEFALRAWNQPPRTHGDSLFMSAELAALHIEKANRPRAKQFLDAAMRLDSSMLSHHLLRARFLKKFGSTEEMLRFAAELRNRFPYKARAQMEAGVIFLNHGQRDSGGRCLERAYSLDSTDILVLVNYGNFLLLDDKNQLATEVFKRSVELEPMNFSANLGLGSALYFSNQVDEARKYLLRARSLAETATELKKVQYVWDLMP